MSTALENWCTLPTPMGEFRMYDTNSEEVRIVCYGDLADLGNEPLLRIHSSCLASEVFGALDCDCADQLREAMKLIATEGSGMIVHLHQEGRGQGLSRKIKAVHAMQIEGLDTAEAFESLGLAQDIRDYAEVVRILKQLRINSVRLISNNPRKINYLKRCGIRVCPVNTHPTIRPENADYLQTKNIKLGHQLPLDTDLKSKNNAIYFYHSDQPWGELSNFSRHAVYLNGRIWPTVEHFYQAQKFEGTQQEEEIRRCATPILAKKRAYEFTPRISQEDWDAIKESIMLKGLRAKFGQHPDLKDKLLASGDRRLVEHTEQDHYWGDAGDDSGQNRLGYLLMQVRNELRQETNIESLAS